VEGDVGDAAEDVGRHGGGAGRRGVAELLEVPLREVHDGAPLPWERCDGAGAGVPELQTHRRAGPRRRARGRGAAPALRGRGAGAVGCREEDLLLVLHGVVEVDPRHRFDGHARSTRMGKAARGRRRREVVDEGERGGEERVSGAAAADCRRSQLGVAG
jgi:hypothetical protein